MSINAASLKALIKSKLMDSTNNPIATNVPLPDDPPFTLSTELDGKVSVSMNSSLNDIAMQEGLANNIATAVAEGIVQHFSEQGVAGAGGSYIVATKDAGSSQASIGAFTDIEFDGAHSLGPVGTISHSLTVTPDRFTVTATGIYYIMYNVSAVGSTTDVLMSARLRINDTTTVPGSLHSSHGLTSSTVDAPLVRGNLVSLSAGEFVTLQLQAAGGTLTAPATDNVQFLMFSVS